MLAAIGSARDSSPRRAPWMAPWTAGLAAHVKPTSFVARFRRSDRSMYPSGRPHSRSLITIGRWLPGSTELARSPWVQHRRPTRPTRPRAPDPAGPRTTPAGAQGRSGRPPGAPQGPRETAKGSLSVKSVGRTRALVGLMPATDCRTCAHGHEGAVCARRLCAWTRVIGLLREARGDTCAHGHV